MEELNKKSHEWIDKSLQLLTEVKGRNFAFAELVDKAIALAGHMTNAMEVETNQLEKQKASLMSKMINDPKGMIFTSILTDRLFRTQSHSQRMSLVDRLINKLGYPDFLGNGNKQFIFNKRV